jgi:predicted alpha/beta-hydrolase family hydrolase
VGAVHTYETPAADAPTFVFAHGAGAGETHPWMIRVAEGLAAHGIRVVTFNFPYMEAHKKVPDKGPELEQAFARTWREIAAHARGPMFAGGKSMGGRIASQTAAKAAFDPAPVGLVFFGYPLHPPAAPKQRRDRHLPSITQPMLFLHGTRDSFGSPEEMTALMQTLPTATLQLIDGGDHSLVAPKRQDPEGRSVDTAIDAAARWIGERS